MSTTTNAVLAAIAVAAIGGVSLQADKDKKTQDVNVVNVPTVNINGVPAVRVVDDRVPVQFQYALESSALGHSMPLEEAYVVPEGKRLTITHASGITVTGLGVNIINVELHAVPSEGLQNPRAQVSMALGTVYPTSSDRNIGNFSQPLDFVVNSGERVGFGYARSSAFVGSPVANVRINVSGYLTDEPAP